MKTLLRRKPTPDPEQLDDAVDGGDLDAVAPHPVAGWTAGSALATKAATGVLWTALIAGPVALFMAFAAMSAAAPPPTVAAAAAVDLVPATAVSEFGQRAVVAWLTTARGSEDTLRQLGIDDDLTLPAVPFTVTHPTVARVTPLGATPGKVATTWSVVVAADVSGPKQPAARRFYAIAVRYTAGATRAITQPAPVPAPAVAESVQVELPYAVDSSSALYTSVEQFLAALTTGQAEVARYTTPGSTISAVTPPLLPRCNWGPSMRMWI